MGFMRRPGNRNFELKNAKMLECRGTAESGGDSQIEEHFILG